MSHIVAPRWQEPRSGLAAESLQPLGEVRRHAAGPCLGASASVTTSSRGIFKTPCIRSRGAFPMHGPRLTISAILISIAAGAAFAQAPAQRPSNVVLFVADGLRSRVVDETTAPTMAAIAREGVSLRNSHALFPTFTTANASAMATGHMLGDTGDFSNTIYAGFEVPGAGKSLTPFLESDPVLADIDEHFSGNYLDEATILKLARDKGYSTASIGKIGPALIFDHTERTGAQTIIVDDATGSAKGIPLSAEMTDRLKAAGLPLATPPRGANRQFRQHDNAGTLSAERRAAGLFRRGRRPRRSCRCSRSATSRSSWCSGRAIPTAPSTIRATA